MSAPAVGSSGGGDGGGGDRNNGNGNRRPAPADLGPWANKRWRSKAQIIKDKKRFKEVERKRHGGSPLTRKEFNFAIRFAFARVKNMEELFASEGTRFRDLLQLARFLANDDEVEEDNADE